MNVLENIKEVAVLASDLIEATAKTAYKKVPTPVVAALAVPPMLLMMVGVKTPRFMEHVVNETVIREGRE